MSAEYQSGYRAYQSGNFALAQSQWHVAANNHDPFAQYALGLLYYRGETGPVDYKQAAKWFSQAAKANHGGATYYIGLLYFNGHGLNYDQFRATEYFKRALHINPHNANAAYLIGAQYFHGRGASQNFVEAAHYFEIAAKENMHAAQFMFGAMLERGWGVPQNYAESYYWLKRATLGVVSLPTGAEEEKPMDAKAAVSALEPRLRPEEIKRINDRLTNEAAG
ncbi:tetratricopeptide repeat protein [Thalassospira lucentensis]|uniref:tetratricopeptide repeat protein n=1 Tax=Thalassospira lucentensis TaxID=168935 RepID=UPI003D2EE1E6